MRAVGIVRRVDELGRFVIPKELRHTIGIDSGDHMEIYVNGEMIVLQKFRPSCIFCGSHDSLVDFKGSLICQGCVNSAQRI